MKISVENKTGLRMLFDIRGPVFIRDENGRIIHYRKKANLENGIFLNLEKGNYFISPEPYKWKFESWLKKTPQFELPVFEKRNEDFDPEKYRVDYIENLDYTPARTCVKTNKIEVGPRMERYPLPVARFIIFHEVGHRYYFTEWKCDIFALWLMSLQGFGLSQCYYAISETMAESPAKKERLKKISQYIKRIKNG